MIVKKTKFTPDVLISLPRRSSAVPNNDVSAVLFEESTYSFKDQKVTTQLCHFSVSDNSKKIVDSTGRASNLTWVDQDEFPNAVLFLREREGDPGTTDLLILEDVSADKLEEPYIAGTFEGPVDELKHAKLDPGVPGFYTIAVTGKANPDGSLYNPNSASKPKSTARLYNSLFVRHWNHYVTPQRNSIFCTLLSIYDASGQGTRMYMGPVINHLKGTGLESPMPPFGAKDNFDISPAGLVFVARDPALNPALRTKCNIYLVMPRALWEPSQTIETVNLGDFKGALTSPRFNAEGTKVVFLAMREDGYEADRNEILVLEDVKSSASIIHYRASAQAKKAWDRSPNSICFSHDGKEFWVTADDNGSNNVFRLPVDVDDASERFAFPLSGSVGSVTPLPDRSFFIEASNLTDPSIWSVINIPAAESSAAETTCMSSLSEDGRLLGLDKVHYSSHTIPSPSSTTGHIQYWETRPSHFDASKTYPLALFIHGGPQGAWNNAWSTRWNPAVFAEQGYIVITPNITGSTGFGQAFTDAIQNQWGGRPYHDLEAVFAHLEKNVPYVDTERAVALGASYGGFMVNWIQGHPLGRKLKALVCHDGVFSSKYELATDELYFTNHEFGGPWDPADPARKEAWARWDPSEHTDQWRTPQLVIHSEKDYRLSMSDGLAAFNMLQSRDVESQFLTFEDENHFVLGRENSLRWHEVVLSFINGHVGLPGWEREKGDIEGIRMDPDLRRKEHVGRVRVVGAEGVVAVK